MRSRLVGSARECSRSRNNNTSQHGSSNKLSGLVIKGYEKPANYVTSTVMGHDSITSCPILEIIVKGSRIK